MCAIFLTHIGREMLKFSFFFWKTLRLSYYQSDVLLSIFESRRMHIFFQNSLVLRGNSFSYWWLNLFIQILTLKFRIMICVSRISYFELNLIWAFVHTGFKYIKSKWSKSIIIVVNLKKIKLICRLLL